MMVPRDFGAVWEGDAVTEGDAARDGPPVHLGVYRSNQLTTAGRPKCDVSPATDSKVLHQNVPKHKEQGSVTGEE